ncbi:unnamed protein product [Lasius platythorax]|uniref:Uncharacterized protein n=1 Tax=Lasius platythorax TaxID=488582 RepID=A0AAV2N0M6_9HYME
MYPSCRDDSGERIDFGARLKLLDSKTEEGTNFHLQQRCKARDSVRARWKTSKASGMVFCNGIRKDPMGFRIFAKIHTPDNLQLRKSQIRKM